MPQPITTPKTPRAFAVKVVKELCAAGFEALWAGGCVRDDLLGISPKDYDVATTATPQQVIDLFGKRRTVPVGVSFGVVMVLGPNRSCGQIEVATFRTDGKYLDGRRPESVQFCSAEEDARRRDFTINGMFYDPIAERLIDYVGGLQDLAAGVVRAIGDPTARFTEDKLRMLRAIRFAATFDFSLDASTKEAASELRHAISEVSAERIAQELRRMLAHKTRAISMQKLTEVGLHEAIFSYIVDKAPEDYFEKACVVLDQLREPHFEPSLAMLFGILFDRNASKSKQRTSRVNEACRNLKLSNEETNAICWILDCSSKCENVSSVPLHTIKPILADHRCVLLLDCLRAAAIAAGKPPVDADFLSDYLAKTPAEALNPEPLIKGSDLQALGVPAGPVFRQLLTVIRNEQLDEVLTERDQALQRLKSLCDS